MLGLYHGDEARHLGEKFKEAAVEKPELLRKLEKIIDQMEREEFWGSLEIDFKKGRPGLIRTHRTQLIEDVGETHAPELRKRV